MEIQGMTRRVAACAPLVDCRFAFRSSPVRAAREHSDDQSIGTSARCLVNHNNLVLRQRLILGFKRDRNPKRQRGESHNLRLPSLTRRVTMLN